MDAFAAMPAAPSEQVEVRLRALRQFLAGCPPNLQAARIVQFTGMDFLGTVEVPLAEVEGHVAASVRDGSAVDWVWRNEVLYLRALVPGGAVASWERVFAEQELADVKSILRDAGRKDA